MKWPMSSRNKRRIAALLAFVFLIILTRHFAGKHHVSEMGESFSSVYKDRLVVEGYIYELSTHLHEKELMMENCQAADAKQVMRKSHHQNHLISKLVKDYEKTKLTEKEAAWLNSLKAHLKQLTAVENSYLNGIRYSHDLTEEKLRLAKKFQLTSSDLRQLSGIQLEVGRQMNEESQRKISQANLFSNADITAMILIALVIQAILFSTRATVIRKPVKFWLN